MNAVYSWICLAILFSPLRLASAAVNSSEATSRPTIKPIRGTWLNLFHQDARNNYTNPKGADMTSPELWRTKIAEMSEMGVKYLIFLAVANEGGALYESDFMPRAYPAGRESPVEAIMNAADKHDMKVFMSIGWAKSQNDGMNAPDVRAGHLKIMRECAAKFSRHPSFFGWYFPVEFNVAPRMPDWAINGVNALAAEARKLTPKAKIMISPYGLCGAVVDDLYAAQLAKLDVDIVAYQDEVGCVRVPNPMVVMKRQFAKLRPAHEKVPRIALWANIESFTWEDKEKPNSRVNALVPAAMPRLLSQMAGVSPEADETISFIVQGMFDKPGSPMPTGQPGCSTRLYENYTDFLAGRGRWPLLAASFQGDLTHAAVGKPATLASPPNAKYDRGNLADGRLGDENILNPRWLGFEIDDFEAVVDLGETLPIETLAARFLQFVPANIRLPKRVEFAVSSNGCDFRQVASVEPETWPNDKHDYWIDMAVTDDLKEKGRYVRVRAVNAGQWLFADELMVNPTVPSKVARP